MVKPGGGVAVPGGPSSTPTDGCPTPGSGMSGGPSPPPMFFPSLSPSPDCGSPDCGAMVTTSGLSCLGGPGGSAVGR